uniref:Calpain catalytic domain-containing protein n=1 Tax=Eptatretus burgeri TaxID=7764 RepID=A0A8C4WRN1_EPTBU
MGAATYHSPQLIRRPGAPQLPCWHRRLEAVEFPEEKTAEGLVLGHAYSLTGLEKVQHKGRVVELVRLRNPWGKIEWKGPWSDGSTEWDEIESRARRYLRVKLEDGEFWMTIQDFVRFFKRIDLCHRTPDNISEGRCSNWSLTVFRGKWEAGKTAGGSFRNVATFGKNSQYHLRLLEADNGGLCTLFVCLMQEPRDRQRNRSPYVAIGFAIYKVPKHCVGIKLSSEYLQWVRPAVRIPRYDAYREMSRHCRLPPGSYVIIPSTDEPDIEAQFLLRVFSLKRNYAEEIKEEAPIKVWTQMDNIYLLDIQFDEPFHALFDDATDLDAKGLFNILKKISSKNPDFQKRVLSKDTCKKAIIFMDVSFVAL